MRSKAKLMCCVVAVLGLVATGSQAALFEDDFSGDLSKWTVTSAQTADDKVEITAGDELYMHSHAVLGSTADLKSRLTTNVSFAEIHTLELDVRKPTGETDPNGFNVRYGSNPHGDISYYVEWLGAGVNMNVYTYNASWGYRGSVGGNGLAVDTTYRLVIENAATEVKITIFEGVDQVSTFTASHSFVNTDRTIMLETNARKDDNTSGIYVDNVLVTPEPATMTLLLLGLPLALRRRKK